ncbi:MAG: multidrug transporter permease [Paenibacillaceae bacterium]|jgi:ATP-binding cassette subfamily B protein|nr:multidrug transporter permease [Paenibacillaceae bacterium]
MKEKHWISSVLSFAAPCKPQLSVSVLCALISVAGGLIPYIGVYRIILLFFGQGPTVSDLLLWSGVCLGGYIIKVGFYALSTMLAHYSAYSILEGMRLEIAAKLMEAPLGTVLNQSIGKHKSVIIDRIETIELPLAHLIPEGISNLLLPVCVFSYLVWIDWRMALAAMITIPVAAAAYTIMMRTFNKQYADFMESSNAVNSVIVEYVEGIEVIKAFNQSASSYQKFEQAVEAFREYTLGWFRKTWKLMNFGSAVLPSTLLGTMPAGMALYLHGSLDAAELAICLILSLGVIGPLTSFTVFVNEAKAIEYAVKEADQFLRLKGLEKAEEPVKLRSYNIELDQVFFSYDPDCTGASGSKGGYAISDLSLMLPEGSFSALVGPSGGGKSTVARLIARFWDADGGEIRIGGIPVKQIPLDQLADTVSFVTQDNYLFNCSLMENIRLGNPSATDGEVIQAAKAACCDEFIRGLEYGYDTKAGEAGGKLSGGEKQRISIARAILKNAPIVILDEATAFTDPENEDQLQRSIRALTKGKTLLVIAHRLSTIRNADRIIVMDHGRIVQTGPHGELLETCGLYKRMWESHIGAKTWAVHHGRKEVQVDAGIHTADY